MRTDPVMYLRLPADLVAWVKAKATANHRSMTGEMSAILEAARRQDDHARQQQGTKS